MVYSITRTQRASRMVNTICGLLFVAFCLSFLALQQRDFISFAQHFYSAGRNVNHGYTFSFIITIALTLLGIGLQHSIHLPIRFRALNWIPSTFLLALLSSFGIGSFTKGIHTVSIWSFVLFLFLYLIIYILCLQSNDRSNENSSLFVFAWPNMLILLCGFMYVADSAITNETFLDELKIERAVGEERWKDALDDIKRHENPTRFMTSMCPYILAMQGNLGDEYFKYASKDGSKVFLPVPRDSLRPWNPVKMYKQLLGSFPGTDMCSTDYLEYLMRDTIATDRVPEFLLTSYLLDRKLDKFASHLIEYYPPVDTITSVYSQEDLLPKSFREALCLYSTMSQSSTKIVLNDSVMSSSFAEFDSLRTITPLSDEDKMKIGTFKGSYWYYFYYLK